jgi:hypothetical protein
MQEDVPEDVQERYFQQLFKSPSGMQELLQLTGSEAGRFLDTLQKVSSRSPDASRLLE